VKTWWIFLFMYFVFLIEPRGKDTERRPKPHGDKYCPIFVRLLLKSRKGNPNILTDLVAEEDENVPEE
jgi:hypothetical protein